MGHGHFVWTDLSTYDMAAARADYGALFGWAFSGDTNYDFAGTDAGEVAAVFPMPEALAQREMPSFWMSYVQVTDLDATVDKARSHEEVIVEVPPTGFGDGARVSLLRDPSGAGFTLYEGPDLPRVGQPTRFHHSADVSQIAPFYRDLFDWRFQRVKDAPWVVYDVVHADGTRVAQAEEVPTSIRGTFSYWMPCFAVGDLTAVVDGLIAQGGAEVDRLSGGRRMCADRQGAHFMLRFKGPWGGS